MNNKSVAKMLTSLVNLPTTIMHRTWARRVYMNSSTSSCTVMHSSLDAHHATSNMLSASIPCLRTRRTSKSVVFWCRAHHETTRRMAPTQCFHRPEPFIRQCKTHVCVKSWMMDLVAFEHCMGTVVRALLRWCGRFYHLRG